MNEYQIVPYKSGFVIEYCPKGRTHPYFCDQEAYFVGSRANLRPMTKGDAVAVLEGITSDKPGVRKKYKTKPLKGGLGK